MFVKRLINASPKKVFLRSRILFFTNLILLCSVGSLRAQSWNWKGVFVLEPGSLEYKGPVDLSVKDGLVEKIVPSSKEGTPLYLLPGFCDANVTLGANSLGGQKDKKELEEDLHSFLLHGFVLVQSVADANWAEEFARYRRQKGEFPQILSSSPVWIADSPELRGSETDRKGYKILHSAVEAMQAVASRSGGKAHIFLRHDPGELFQLDGHLLYRMRAKADSQKLELSVSSFGEEFATWEALSAGVHVLYHPIPETASIAPVSGNLVQSYWGPMFGVYYNQKQVGTSEFSAEWDHLLSWSPKFREKAPTAEWISSLKGLKEKEKAEADQEYDSYLAFLNARKNLALKILLASGAGNYLTFPGIAGWKEISLLSKILGPKEALRAATETTCTYLGAAHEGKIRTGKSAQFLVFEEDPLTDWGKLRSLKTIVTERKKTEIAPAKKTKVKGIR
ncbi:hypothetical protein EHO61_00735 [Leptospira fluminis]|uniref:Amidohydrolase n=1 Tax=Leptospira fluminis TaxID=2484979 RepID=A0A4V3JEZ4_9LEPT|nr:hypothetical protein [Leptospira fluminis]TGK22339.1 hypothetical protein EHO61_00735 [Leptospira fluminis]